MNSSPRRVTRAALAPLALAVMVLATFAGALHPARVLFERDIHAYWYPQRAALLTAVAEGSLPLWNPWVGFGAPFLADASSELAYPPTWLLLPLPLPIQVELATIGHALLAAAGAAALARRLLGGALSAAVAGAAYALAGPLLSAASLYHHFAGAALMPWVLWGLEGLLQRRDRASALVLGALSAGQVLAGSGDLVLMTTLAALGRVALHVHATRGLGLAGLLRRLALSAVLSLSISAVQWLPTVERSVHGLRAAQDFRTRTYWSLHRRRSSIWRCRGSCPARRSRPPRAAVSSRAVSPCCRACISECRRWRSARWRSCFGRRGRSACGGAALFLILSLGASRRSTPCCSSCPGSACCAIRRNTCCPRRSLSRYSRPWVQRSSRAPGPTASGGERAGSRRRCSRSRSWPTAAAVRVPRDAGGPAALKLDAARCCCPRMLSSRGAARPLSRGRA
jgi:hypothetical protein